MKKLLVLAALVAGIAWAVNRQNGSAKPADPWADASDAV